MIQTDAGLFFGPSEWNAVGGKAFREWKQMEPRDLSMLTLVASPGAIRWTHRNSEVAQQIANEGFTPRYAWVDPDSASPRTGEPSSLHILGGPAEAGDPLGINRCDLFNAKVPAIPQRPLHAFREGLAPDNDGMAWSGRTDVNEFGHEIDIFPQPDGETHGQRQHVVE